METLEGLFERLERLNDVGASLSDERDLDRLLEKILLAVMSITQADGGTLYTVTEDQRHLRFRIVRTHSLGIAFGGSCGKSLPPNFVDLPMYGEDGQPNDHMIAPWSAVRGKTVNIEDAYTATGFDFSGTMRFDAATGYRSRSFLSVPMRNHEGVVIGVLQLINATDSASGAVHAFSKSDQSLAESLASQAAVALTNRALIDQLEGLFEAFIQLIVSTIQMLQKLPWPQHLVNVPEYAGGHHERMDGRGYPKGLTREQMSVQARMMGIADIFEALTAADRPYKPPMPLSQALGIMERFRRDGHIDPDLYDVFLAQRVPQRYAERFLAPDQLDC